MQAASSYSSASLARGYGWGSSALKFQRPASRPPLPATARAWFDCRQRDLLGGNLGHARACRFTVMRFVVQPEVQEDKAMSREWLVSTLRSSAGAHASHLDSGAACRGSRRNSTPTVERLSATAEPRLNTAKKRYLFRAIIGSHLSDSCHGFGSLCVLMSRRRKLLSTRDAR
jgi:hypothetical protein